MSNVVESHTSKCDACGQKYTYSRDYSAKTTIDGISNNLTALMIDVRLNNTSFALTYQFCTKSYMCKQTLLRNVAGAIKGILLGLIKDIESVTIDKPPLQTQTD